MRAVRLHARSQRRTIALAASLLLTTTSAIALGQTPQPQAASASDRAAAEALWNEGRKLRSEGKIKEACPKFVESYRLDPGLGTLLNMASCHELEGRIATAWGEYRDAAQQAERANDKRKKFAADHAAALESRLPHLVIIAVDPVPGLTVTRDGVTLGLASLGSPLPVDPGAHQISAKAPGYEPFSAQVEVETGKKLEVKIPALTALPPEPDAPVTPGLPVEPPKDRADGSVRVAGFVVGGVGVAAVAVGAVFGVLSGNQADIAEENCGEEKKCTTPEGIDAVSKGTNYAWVSNIGFGVGAVGVILGTYLIITGGADPEPDAPAAEAAGSWTILPSIGPQGGEVRARFVF
jgi:hypothetical protein